MSKILGFDLGESSIGWAILDSEKGEIVNMGCKVFQSTCQRKKYKINNVPKEVSNKTQALLILGKYFKFIQVNSIVVILFSLLITTIIFLLMNLHDWQFWFSLSFTALITLLSIINEKRK